MTSQGPPLSFQDFLLPLAIAGGFLAVATWQAGLPNVPIYDEVYHVPAAIDMLRGAPSSEWSHPPLGKWLIAAGIGLLQVPTEVPSTPLAFSWRFMSALFAALSLVLTYALGRCLFRSRLTGALAAGLLALDGVFLVQARAGMLNHFELAFTLAALLFTWRALARWRPADLMLAGLAVGCAIATRWSAVFVWLGIWSWVVVALSHAGAFDRRRLGWVVLAFGVCPPLVYVASYGPELFLSQGGPASLVDPERWRAFGALQARMATYHTSALAPHLYQSPWWSWPLMARPVWYFITDRPPDGIQAVWAIGNAAIWWATLPALGGALAAALRRREKAWAFVASFGLLLWLMWGLQPRQSTYMHYMLPVLPFVCLALGQGLRRLWEGALARPLREQRALVIGYMALATAWLVFYFPLLTWQPFSRVALLSRLWLGSHWQ